MGHGRSRGARPQGCQRPSARAQSVRRSCWESGGHPAGAPAVCSCTQLQPTPGPAGRPRARARAHTDTQTHTRAHAHARTHARTPGQVLVHSRLRQRRRQLGHGDGLAHHDGYGQLQGQGQGGAAGWRWLTGVVTGVVWWRRRQRQGNKQRKWRQHMGPRFTAVAHVVTFAGGAAAGRWQLTAALHTDGVP